MRMHLSLLPDQKHRFGLSTVVCHTVKYQAMASEILINAKIYVSGQKDYNWMKFDSASGIITDMGRGAPSDSGDVRVLDMGGRRVFPGFHDAHIHVASVGHLEYTVQLIGCESIEELQTKIRQFVEKNRKEAWIVGRGWDQELLGRYPTREDLDAVCPDKPVIMKRICGHVSVVNSLVVQMAGITKNSKDPAGGQIDRYPEGHPRCGQPNGVLRESAVTDLVAHLATHGVQEHLKWITSGMRTCLRHGLTAVHSNESNLWNEYKHLASQDKLPIRVFLAAYYHKRDEDNFPRPGESVGPMLSCDRVKLFSDGALGPSTAALSIPYKNGSGMGILLYSSEKLQSLVREAHMRGYRLEIHAIGDRAADEVITAFEKARIPPEKRPILTHCQFLRDSLMDRMAAGGVVANIQPQFLPSDAAWLEQLIPDKLQPWAYAWKTLLNKGVVCSGGSDAPVEKPAPLLGIYDVIFRPSCPAEREPAKLKTHRNDESFSVQEAVDLYTKWGAYATLREHDLGELKVGYQADFVLIDSERDPVEYPEEFLTAKIHQVWIRGLQKDLTLDYTTVQ